MKSTRGKRHMLENAHVHRTHLEAFFRAHGRMTKARMEIIKYLLKSERGISLKDLIQHVAADEVSVYRTIALLKKYNHLEEIELLSGERVLALVTPQDHHHHAICSDCKTVFHIPCTRQYVPTQLPKEFHSITSHSVTFYGVCTRCKS